MKTAEQYYDSLGLDKYNFTVEEANAIKDYYNFCSTNGLEGDGSNIMPIEEENFPDMMEYMKENHPNICLLWGDGNSNWAGVFYKGLLRGKVTFLSHEEPTILPLFKSIVSAVEKFKERKVWDFLYPSVNERPYIYDYPVSSDNPISESEKTENLALAKSFLATLPDLSKKSEEDYEAHCQAAMTAAYLLPSENVQLLYPMLVCGNMYVEQDIPYIFSFHKDKNALPALHDATDRGSIYVKDSILRAIKMIDE